MSFRRSRAIATLAVMAAGGLAILLASAPRVVGQDAQQKLHGYFLVKRRTNFDAKLAQAQSDAGAGLKTWTYHTTSTRTGSKGQKFSGMMVGSSPYTTKGTTTITMQLVPLIINIGTTKFDPTVKDNSCAAGKVPLTLVQQSPMVKPFTFTMNGVKIANAQYTEAFQTASFWTPIKKNGGTYRTNLKVVTLKPVMVDATGHSAIEASTCGPLGGVDINWFEPYLENTVIPKLQKTQGVNPTTFPAFVMYNVVMYVGDPTQCCILGYHWGIGSPLQTYSPFEFDTTGAFGGPLTDTYVMAHEVGEWYDDPSGGNPTPPWGHIGQVSGCQNNLEVGDSLTGGGHPFSVTSNGFKYHLQELAFYSWFFGGPSIGSGGKFSDNGTFTAAQGACK